MTGAGPARLQTGHTGELDPGVLGAARALLFEVFDDMTDADWEHSLGGMHALVWEDDELVGHAALIQRRLMHGGRALRAGYVEGVGVRADRRRRGHGGLMMDELEGITRRAYDLGALGATDEGAAFYVSRGWQPWRGRCSALTPEGIVRTEDEEGCVYVLPVAARLDLSGELTCDWRDGDVW
jgi:aminoglycoside 2'-N-acetyltransferase I